MIFPAKGFRNGDTATRRYRERLKNVLVKYVPIQSLNNLDLNNLVLVANFLYLVNSLIH
ncbi:hypothetical protein [Floridanema aerugineum]